MTTNKPEAVAFLVTATHKRHKHGHLLLELSELIAEGQAKHWAQRGCDTAVEPLIRLSDYKALQAECEKLREQLESVKELLKDPVTVFVHMKHGIIAKPSLRDLIDLHGDVPNGEDVQLLEITKHRSESERLRKLVAECSDYLGHNEHTCIHNGSALHRKLAEAAMQATIPSGSTN